MKLIKASIAALLALGFAGAASAQTVIYIAGAPATRQTDTTAIYNTLVNNSGGNNIWVVADAGITTTDALRTTASVNSGTYNSANHVNFYGGTDSAGNPITVKVSYNGSTAAVQSLAAQGTGTHFLQPYLTDSAYTANSNNFSATLASSGTDNAQPVIGLGDTFQATTPWEGPTNLATGATTVNYQQLNDQVVGAVPYVFIASVSSDAAGLTNITSVQAQQLFTSGSLPLSFFTGNSGDTTPVYAIGRDTGSGARFIAFSTVGISVDPTQQIKQYEPVVTGTSSTVTAGSIGSTGNTPTPPLAPQSTVNGQVLSAGAGGYASFGPEGSVVESTSSIGYFIGYFNTFDANSIYKANGNSHKPLSFNGVTLNATLPYSNDGTAEPSVANGSYGFWSYEHVLDAYPTDDATNNFETSLVSDLQYHDATILLSNLNVGRAGYDGGPVAPGIAYAAY